MSNNPPPKTDFTIDPETGYKHFKSGCVQDPKTGYFVKGHSGNPGGKGKQTKETLDFLRSKTMDAAILLVKMMEKTKSEKIRLACINAVFDRVMGRPSQTTHIETDNTTFTAQPIIIPNEAWAALQAQGTLNTQTENENENENEEMMDDGE